MTAAGLISATDLTLERAGRTLVSGFSLTLAKGEAQILLGPNGSGKTTLLRALAGLFGAQTGEIRRPDDCEMAFLGHGDALKPSETVLDALTFWARLYGADLTAIDDAMHTFQIAHLERRACGRLSAGQKRRVALARTQLSGRPLWLLDEPAAPLDTAGRACLARAVTRHCAAGGGVIAATHVDLGWEGAAIRMLTP